MRLMQLTYLGPGMLALAIVMLLLRSAVGQNNERLPNGFVYQKGLIALHSIVAGGPPRDGIPAVMHPEFTKVSETDWLNTKDRVLVVRHKGIEKAYPLRILTWHEAVNDRIAGDPFLITYCPLCFSAAVFRVPPKTTFGISGLLYNSNVLLYDHQTESLWSQLRFQAVSGPRSGEKLELFQSMMLPWGTLSRKNPEALVLSRATGFGRNYSRDPYERYYESKGLMQEVSRIDGRLGLKEKVFVVIADEKAKAYPLSVFGQSPSPIDDVVGDMKVKIYHRDGLPVRAEDQDGVELPTVHSFWFAWFAFRPDTLIAK